MLQESELKAVPTSKWVCHHLTTALILLTHSMKRKHQYHLYFADNSIGKQPLVEDGSLAMELNERYKGSLQLAEDVK